MQNFYKEMIKSVFGQMQWRKHVWSTTETYANL